MAQRRSGILRILKPVAAGVACAYLATAWVDRPAPIHFEPENPYAAQQSKIVEPPVDIVMVKNIMKLGTPLSVLSAPDAPGGGTDAPEEINGDGPTVKGKVVSPAP